MQKKMGNILGFQELELLGLLAENLGIWDWGGMRSREWMEMFQAGIWDGF